MKVEAAFLALVAVRRGRDIVGLDEIANGAEGSIPDWKARWIAKVCSLVLVRCLVQYTVIVELLGGVIIMNVTTADFHVVKRVFHRPLFFC